MKKVIGVLVGAIILTGCARPHVPADTILNQELVTPNSSEQQTKITVTRNKQFIGSASGGVCKFLISVDGRDVARLQQNQFVIAYLKNGLHKLMVSNECSVLSMGMRKTVDVIANGGEQEYVTEVGLWGQYRLWQTK